MSLFLYRVSCQLQQTTINDFATALHLIILHDNDNIRIIGFFRFKRVFSSPLSFCACSGRGLNQRDVIMPSVSFLSQATLLKFSIGII